MNWSLGVPYGKLHSDLKMHILMCHNVNELKYSLLL